jgi:hypothetical protein
MDTLHRALLFALFFVSVCHSQCPVLSLVFFTGSKCVFLLTFVATPFSVSNCEVSCPENVCCVGWGCHPAAEHRLFTAFFCSLSVFGCHLAAEHGVLLHLFVVSLCFCSGWEFEIWGCFNKNLYCSACPITGVILHALSYLLQFIFYYLSIHSSIHLHYWFLIYLLTSSNFALNLV